MAPLPRVVVYDRTSGDEASTGQNPNAQLNLTVALARAAGFEVAGVFGEADVKGDSPWGERVALPVALVSAAQEGAPVFVREVSRLWRGEPARGLVMLEQLPDLVVHGEPAFERRAGAWVRDADADHLVRFIALWQAWAEKRRLTGRTQEKMDALGDGAPTKSGKPVGRPVVEIEPEHVEEARRLRAGGASWTDVRARVLELRGYNEVKDPEAKKRRDVSADSIKRALGVKGRPGQKSDPGKTPDAPARVAPESNGSLVPRSESGQNTSPGVSAGATATDAAGRAQAVTGGGPA